MTKDVYTNAQKEEIDRRLNQEATLEKLKTSKKDIKNLKTLEDILKERR